MSAARDRWPGDAVSAAACAVVVAGAAVVFVALAVPVFGWHPTVQGVIALVVLAGAASLAYWLPDDTPGAAAAVLALLGLTFASPWVRLFHGGSYGVVVPGQLIDGVVDLAAAAALAWFLVRRHRRAGVYAAAAYTLAASLATFLASLVFDPDSSYGPASEWGPVLIVALPLLLLAIPAAAVAFGPRAAVGQAVGAVVLAAAGFLPMKILVGEFAGGETAFVMRESLRPLTPTDWLSISSILRSVTGPALVAVVVLVIVAFVLAASLARRPSAPLAASVTLLLLSSVQASLLTALAEWSAEEAELLGVVLGIGAVVAAALAVGVGAAAARRSATAVTDG